MAVNRQSTSALYYDGYDPNWIIGTGRPAPVYAPPPHASGPNRQMAAVAPLRTNEFVPPVKPHPGDRHVRFQEPLIDDSHGGKGKKHSAPHGQNPRVGNHGPPHAHATGTGVPHGVPMKNVNPKPFLRAPGGAVNPGVVSEVLYNQTSAPVAVIHRVPQKPPLTASVTALKVPPVGPPRIAAPGLGEIPVNAVIKVVMYVPICCEGCNGKWKDVVSELPGFQGYDFERRFERLTVFGQVSPSAVLATVKKVIPGTRMWRQ
ncbi:hypothetical protein R1sor_010909 [Riccia sorocarpa]|uniref:HMA domain-containing protein n=1 Tax=Riccia sorocarpa TaxID=122646 RepID=A0ABD3HZQ8_9MARC